MERQHFRILLFLLIALTGQAIAEEHSRSKRAPVDWLSAPTLTSADIQMIVDKHNFQRRSVDPPASDMKEMYWDEDLASKAKDRSKKCTAVHSNEEGIGENIQMISTADPKQAISAFVDIWSEESAFYDHENSTCEEGRPCGHYTQIIWSSSDSVGCGVSRCQRIDNIEAEAFLVVCKYRAQGNIKIAIDGVNYDVSPYASGTPCSQCDSGLTCKDKLCSRPPGTTPAITSPDDLINLAKGTTSSTYDICYKKNKEMIDKWEASMVDWRDTVQRWTASMNKYEEYMENIDDNQN